MRAGGRRTPLRGLLAVAAPAFLAGFAGACGTSDGRDDVLTDSSYIEVMARLVRTSSRITTRDSVRGDSARRAILAEHGVDSSQLFQYAELYGEDAGHMAAIWTAVNLRVLALDSLAQEEEARAEEREAEAREEEREEEARVQQGEAIGPARDTLSTRNERE